MDSRCERELDGEGVPDMMNRLMGVGLGGIDK